MPTDVASFYHLDGVDLSQVLCQGTACFAARHLNPARWALAAEQTPRVYCLGKCFAAPAAAHEHARPRFEVRSRQAVVLERLVDGPATTLDEYRRSGGLRGLAKAHRLAPAEIIEQIERSELRGRGGAGFPTATKWRTVAQQPLDERFVVANFDEGDPGAYIDRFLVEGDPFCLIEGMVIAARAVGARRGWIYARCEYPRAIEILRRALAEARDSGLLESKSLGGSQGFEIELIVGRGSYECGEETSLLNSIEGRRPVARARPPHTAQRGLWGRPTLVNNVETLACVPWILRQGATQFASLGIPGSRGTKVLSLNSLFRRPGLYEVEFGMPLADVVEQLGGGLRHGRLTALLIGGPLAGVLPPESLDTRLGFAEMRAVGASVGHGGVVAFDEQTSMAQLIRHVFSFAAYESCGECTPCRLGSRRIEQLLSRVENDPAAPLPQGNEWREIVAALKQASLCGLGTGLAEFAESVSRYFPEAVQSCFT